MIDTEGLFLLLAFLCPYGFSDAPIDGFFNVLVVFILLTWVIKLVDFVSVLSLSVQRDSSVDGPYIIVLVKESILGNTSTSLHWRNDVSYPLMLTTPNC